jgi:ribosomal protein L21
MEKVTTILNNNIEKQTLKSLDKLADALDTTTTSTTDDVVMEEDDKSVQSGRSSKSNTKISTDGIYEGKGENKVIVSKKSKRKQKHGYRMKSIVTVTTATARKRVKVQPKFFCSF